MEQSIKHTESRNSGKVNTLVPIQTSSHCRKATAEPDVGMFNSGKHHSDSDSESGGKLRLSDSVASDSYFSIISPREIE